MTNNNTASNFILRLAQKKYENEIYREDSIIQHASQLQTAFSFITAGEFMVAPIIIDHRGNLSLEFLLLVFSTITLLLLFSLFAATMAQSRKTVRDFPSIDDLKEHIEKNEKSFQTECQCNDYYTKTLAGIDADKTTSNNNRIKWIQFSTYSFYGCLLLCVFWFIISLSKIL